MNLMYNILSIYLLLDVCISMRNFHLPHRGGYFHHSDLAMQHDTNHQEHYDSYSSEEVVMRQRKSPRRTKYQRRFGYSDSECNYKCKCSCTKCQKRKLKPCCEDFCATECAVKNNILVLPYPVPFMVFNQSAPDFPMPPTSTTTTITTTTTTTTEQPTTLQTTPPTRKTMPVTFSTAPYYEEPYKRFQIINEMNLRRNMGMGNNGLRSPHKFGRLPKYGIVPIPENLALSLMQQIRKDQNSDQLRKSLSQKNLLDFNGAGLPFAQ